MSVVYLGIGSNREREVNIRAGVQALYEQFASADCPLVLSRVFESEAVGFAGTSFYNLVARIETSTDVLTLNQQLKQIEQKLGHHPDAPRYSPRTLDIDILLYDQLVSRKPVQLPRDEILTNAFVLWPLAELAPKLQHPTANCSMSELWENYQQPQKLRPIRFKFEKLPYLQLVP